MLKSLLGGWFVNATSWLSKELGNNGVTVFICILSVATLLMFWNICKGAIGKKKLSIKWIQLIFVIIFILLIIWLCNMY